MSAIFTETYEGALIPFQDDDAFMNATALCKAAGKLFNDYSRLGSTKEFLMELSTVTGIPVTGLIVTVQGGSNPSKQGTWVHPDVAIHLAQWCSAKVAVWCNRVIRRILAGDVMFGRRAESVPSANPAVAEMFALMAKLSENGVSRDVSATVASEMVRSSVYQNRARAKAPQPVQPDLFSAGERAQQWSVNVSRNGTRKLSVEKFRAAWDALDDSGFLGGARQRKLCEQLRISKATYYRYFNQAF